MNKLYRLAALLPVLLLISCGDDPDPLVWGDLAMPLAEVHCARAAECFSLEPTETAVCVRHDYSHLCELDSLCGVRVDATAMDLVGPCVDDMAVLPCFNLFYGILPASCSDLLAVRPDDAR